MAVVAHTHPFVIGVGTHARNHAVSILACPFGEVVDEARTRTYVERRTAEGRTPREIAGASSATSPARATVSSTPPPRCSRLDKHRKRLAVTLPTQVLTALDKWTVVVPAIEQYGRVISGVAAQPLAVLDPARHARATLTASPDHPERGRSPQGARGVDRRAGRALGRNTGIARPLFRYGTPSVYPVPVAVPSIRLATP